MTSPLSGWLSHLRTLLARNSRSTPRRHSSRTERRSNRFRPGVEALEERWVPTTYTVLSTADSGGTVGNGLTLRQAVLDANADTSTPTNTINFAIAGSPTGTQTISLLSGINITRNLIITNAGGANPITIDGTSDTGHLFTLNALTVEFDSLSFTNAQQTAITADGSTGAVLTLKNDTFSTDAGSIGGGATVNATSCAFTGNTAVAINGTSTLTLTTDTFTSNAGGITGVGTLTATGSTFTSNVSATVGGISAGAVTVNQSTFTGNQATAAIGGNGGGISSNTLTATDSTFNNNTCGAWGGGAYAASSLTITDCTFTSNSAGQKGGAVAVDVAGPYTFVEDTIVGNRANTSNATGTGFGGGIWTDYYTASQTTLNGCIVAGNFAGSTGSTADDIAPTVDSSTNSTDNVIGAGGSGGLTNGVNGNQVGVAVSSLNLGALANNGGPTETIALGAGSVAIGAGITHTTASTDQRGLARPVGTPSDVGAYQVGTLYTYTVTATNSASTSQSTEVSTQFALQLAVTVVNTVGGTPAAGITVTFTVPASGASATLALGSGSNFTEVNSTTYTVTTDASGKASVIATANTIAGGPYTVSAAVPMTAGPINFSLTNLPAPSLSQSYVTVSPGLIPKGSTSIVQLHVLSATGAPVNNGSFTVTFSGPNPTLGTFGPVSYIGGGVYQAIFTGTTAGGPTAVHANLTDPSSVNGPVTSTPPTITVVGAQAPPSSFSVLYPSAYHVVVSGGVYYYSGYFTITNHGAAINGPAQVVFTLPSGVKISSAVGATVASSNRLALSTGIAAGASYRFYATFSSPVPVNLGDTQLGLPISLFNGS
jgi:predicted outer membrane repeat protein